jgi:hypothetical protein
MLPVNGMEWTKEMQLYLEYHPEANELDLLQGA